MLKPSLKRHGVESLGMTSFNLTRQMFPTRLDADKEIDPIFRNYPHLMEFKIDDAKLEKIRSKDTGKETKVFVKPINSSYKGSDGTSYGLFQRFYWDEGGIPFGGTPNFKA